MRKMLIHHRMPLKLSEGGLTVIAELLADILLQKKSIMEVLAANILMRISIVKGCLQVFSAMEGKSAYG